MSLPLLGGGSGHGSGGGGLGTPTDPSFANVLLVASFEGTNGDSSYTEQSSYARVMTLNGGTGGSTSNISTVQAEYGASSMRSNNTITGSFASSADYNSISVANSSQYTIEYSYWQSDAGVGSQYDVYNSGNVFIRHNSDGGGGSVTFFWSPTGSGFQSMVTGNAQGGATTWNKFAICKNSSGKIRLFRNGIMLNSTTPADSTIHSSTTTLTLNSSGAAQTAYVDNLRITKDVCRYDSDSNYTTATAAFPTS